MPSHLAVEGRDLYEVAHLALLGIKIQEPAFWGKITKDKGQHRLPFLLSKFI